MTKTVHGKVHGKTIELDEDLGVPDGHEIEITFKLVTAKRLWGEGLRRSAGALADDWTDDDDRMMAEIYESRKQESRKELLE